MDTYRRTGKRKRQANLDMGTIRVFMPYWISAAVTLFILYFLTALIYMFTFLGPGALPVLSKIEAAAVLIIFSAMAGKLTIDGMIAGGFFGFGFSLFLLILGMLFRAISLFSLLFLVLLVTGTLIGCIGGILGSGRKKRRRRRIR